MNNLLTIDEIYSLETDQPRHACTELCKIIETYISEKQYDSLNALMEIVDLNKLGILSLICLVRPTYRVRRFLPVWESCYRKTWEIVDKRENGKARAVFIGMPKIEELDKKKNECSSIYPTNQKFKCAYGSSRHLLGWFN